MKWYQTIYAKVAAIVAGLALLGTVITYVVNVVNWWEEQQSLPGKVEQLRKDLDKIKKDDQTLYDFVESKKQSYAVGHRVKKIYDKEKEKWVKVKQYRDWQGKLHLIYIDLELTEFYGWEQYYYINPETHEKIYV